MLINFRDINYDEFIHLVLTYGVKIIFTLIVLIIGLKLIKWFTTRLNNRLDKSKIDPSLKSFVTPLISVVLKILLLISIISMFGVEMTSFVAILASFGFALGLALQGSLSNFAGGILILILKPYRVGDFIEAGDHSGTVKDIQIFYTYLATTDNKKVVIPNSIMANSSLINYSTYKTRRLEIKLFCSYNNNLFKVKEVIENLLMDHEKILKAPKPNVLFQELSNNSVNFVVRGWVQASDYWNLYNELILLIKNLFDKEEIMIPHQQIDVHLQEKSTS